MVLRKYLMLIMMSGIFVFSSCASGGFHEPSDSVKNLVAGYICFDVKEWSFIRTNHMMEGKHYSEVRLYLEDMKTGKHFWIRPGSKGYFTASGIPAGTYELKLLRVDYTFGKEKGWSRQPFKKDKRYFEVKDGRVNNLGRVTMTVSVKNDPDKPVNQKIESEQQFNEGFDDIRINFSANHSKSAWINFPFEDVLFADRSSYIRKGDGK